MRGRFAPIGREKCLLVNSSRASLPAFMGWLLGMLSESPPTVGAQCVPLKTHRKRHVLEKCLCRGPDLFPGLSSGRVSDSGRTLRAVSGRGA